MTAGKPFPRRAGWDRKIRRNLRAVRCRVSDRPDLGHRSTFKRRSLREYLRKRFLGAVENIVMARILVAAGKKEKLRFVVARGNEIDQRKVWKRLGQRGRQSLVARVEVDDFSFG